MQRFGAVFRVCDDLMPLKYSSEVISYTVLVAFSSFATAAKVSSKPLTSDVIFPAISLFMLLQFPLAMVSESAATQLA